jgi:hypothetical protein
LKRQGKLHAALGLQSDHRRLFTAERGGGAFMNDRASGRRFAPR